MIDLCEDEWRLAEVLCHVISAPVEHKAGLTTISSRRCRACVVQDESRRTIDKSRPVQLVPNISV